MNTSTPFNVIFSGLVVLEGSRRSALVGLLRPASAAGGHEEHGGTGHKHPGHRPLLVVRNAQLRDTTAVRVQLTDLILEGWLSPNSIGDFVGIHLGDKEVVFEATGSGGLTLSPPSTNLRCPADDFSDLGWLVNFVHKHERLTLRSGWEGDAHVAAAIRIPDYGTVTGTSPLDRIDDGSLHRFVFGQDAREREQAYTDAFQWSATVTGDVTLRLIDRKGGPTEIVTLRPSGAAPDLYVLNHPEDLDAEGTPGKHVELVYELPLDPEPSDREPPSPIGKCIYGRDATAAAPGQPMPPPITGSGLGKTYCAACLVWNE